MTIHETVTGIMILKYLSWMLTVGTAFVGSWFLEYTRTDKQTGQKTLTAWGRRGIVFAGLSLACSLGLTIWTDYDSAKKQKEAAERAAVDRDRAINLEQSSNTALSDIKSLLSVISETTLANKDKAAMEQTIARLAGIEDYRRHYPDLYERLIKATSYEETATAISEGIDRATEARISVRPECAHIQRPGLAKGGIPMGYPGGHFEISQSSGLTYMITPEHVEFTFIDGSDQNSLGNHGYKFLFADGSESHELECKKSSNNPMSMSCTNTTSDAGARSVYLDLQKKFVAALKSYNKRYDVPKSTAEAIRTVFSCISP